MLDLAHCFLTQDSFKDMRKFAKVNYYLYLEYFRYHYVKMRYSALALVRKSILLQYSLNFFCNVFFFHFRQGKLKLYYYMVLLYLKR